ncbi:accessory Sec system translocase SecA2 [Allorhizocola rhizosphaerae]|uniref:accessory Sec system translocase SecA2 n=1 Tax=Allorhizocola rhizosphaerae TaxID=1872709 RepID=UPI000E3DEC5B|nr:accessory Sec system translocase SecA2 [Allorhizocola rhizosphaerae]
MSVSQRLKNRFRRFLERPGTTVDLEPFSKLLPEIEARGEELSTLDDAELTAAASEASELVEICAVGREAAWRALGERPYDVQLLGILALLHNTVAEMATGEGKTLAACIAAFGHVRRGNGPVHVLTVNDYLAKRDAEWMEPVYTMLGLSVGYVTGASTPDERRAAYSKDITYASVSEAGFDFLRDQLITDVAQRIQPELRTAIVDEVDSILIDEATVPMVLAGMIPNEQDPVHLAAGLVKNLRPRVHYEVAEDGRSVALTDRGVKSLEAKLGVDLYDAEQVGQLSTLHVALHAHALLDRDVDYIVRNGKVELVDEMRGRVAQRRRWPDGLHAAVEAKEGLDASAEGEVLGTITVQGFIALYNAIAGMTATAVHVGDELREYFKLEVAVIPPNTPCVRVDEPDRIYATRAERDEALIEEIKKFHETGRPILIGTLDISESQNLAEGLRAAGVECAVLNAKNDAEEAAIIAEAGKFGAVTVSTQMAGRGVDIRLGGSDQSDRERVAELGGLYVIGSGRHNSRRVDDQLRGRAGRQGDPGGSIFYVSIEDELIKHHAADSIPPWPRMKFGGLVDDERVTAAVEHAQKVAEGVHYELHRNTWRYSVVIEQQRQALAERRERLLTTDVAAKMLLARVPDKAKAFVEGRLDEWAEAKRAAELDALEGKAELEDSAELDESAEPGEKAELDGQESPAEIEQSEIDEAEIEEAELDESAEVSEVDEQAAREKREARLVEIGRSIALWHLDRLWAEHLAELSEVREGIHLRALGRVDPLDEFHRAAVPAFNKLIPEIEERTVATFEELDLEEEFTPERAELVRPSATWTYLVTDNPFGSELDRLVSVFKRTKR